MKCVLHVGCWPPPMGGVAQYVKRLALHRAAAGGQVRVFNESNEPGPGHPLVLPHRSWVRLCLDLLLDPPDLIHVHTQNLRFRSLLWLWRLRGSRVVVTLHTAEAAEQFGPPGGAGAWWVRANLRWAAHRVILAGDGARQGLTPWLKGWHHVETIPAWVTPPEDTAGQELPAAVARFIGQGSEALVVANGAIRPRPEGDLYGFDLMLEAARRLEEAGRPMRWLFYVSSLAGMDEQARTTYEELRRRSEKLGHRVHWHESSSDEFAPVIARADVVVRSTRHESFGQTVLEGLLAGKPVVASDAAPRLPGVWLHRNGDAGDLAERIQQALDSPPVAVDPKRLPEGCEAQVERLYRELLAR